ncbi:hypothetical protein FRC10_006852 [Ceratobasidium sp. 414]|nr:hypothetical protein FRC10_006852 [Ceratobasidium sp. 414]
MHSSVFRELIPSQNDAPNDDPRTQPGSFDENPIVIHEVEAEAFRNLLVMFYGIISDPVYQAFITDATNDTTHNCETFKRYLDIASLSQRFCMGGLEDWALDQLKRVLSSPERLAGLRWDQNHLLDALSYAKQIRDFELERDVRNLICCHLQARTGWLSGTPIIQSTNAILKQLYQDSDLKDTDPALFGFIFCSVLSLGHKSSVWKDLTQDDRTKLMVAQVYLTPIPRTALQLGWVYRPSDLEAAINAQSSTGCSSDCATRFTKSVFHKTFASSYIKRLESEIPLTGLSALRELPKLRRDIAIALKREALSRELEDDCAKHILLWLDEKINTVFKVLSDSYHNKIH